MRRVRTYNGYLTLLGVVLLSIVLLFLTASLYGDSVDETRALLLSSAQTNLNAAAYKIEGEFALIHSVCETLNSSPHLAELVQTYTDPHVSRIALGKAYTDLRDTLNAQIYRSDSIRAIYLYTPARVIDVQKNVISASAYISSPYADAPVTPEVTLYENEDGVFRFSFSLSAFPDCAVHIDLYPQAFSDLLAQCESTLLRTADGRVITADENASGLYAKDALNEFLSGSKSAAITSGYCFARTPLTQLGLNWDIIYAVHADSYLSAYRLTLLASIAAFVVALFLALLLGRIIARRAIRPLHTLIARVRRFRVGSAPGEHQRGLGLHEGVFLYATLSVSLGMLVCIVLFSAVSTRIQSQHRQALSEATLSAVSSSLEGTFDEIRDTVLKMASDSRVQTYVNAPTEANRASLETALRENANAYSSACTLRLISREGDLLYSSSYLDVSYLSGEATLNDWQHTQDPYGQSLFSLAIRIYETTDSLVGAYHSSVIAQQLSQLASQQGPIYLVDAAGVPLDGSLLPSTGGEYITRAIAHTPWSVCMPYEHVTLAEGVLRTLRGKAELVIALLLSAVFLSSLLSSLLLAPLTRLSAAMRAVSRGQLAGLQTFATQHLAIDELSELNESFIEMADRIELLIDDLITSRNHLLMLENAKKNAEINALQMQITPHFLSNTIMLIADRIRTGHADEATGMLYAMNRLFRYGISRRDLIISVREEWAYAQAYAQIMAARKGTLTFEWDMDERALERSTIRLILQPILENAIYHGARKDGAANVIRVSCCAEQDETLFSVSDNGPGLDAEKLSQLRRSLQEETHESSIGLFNVQSRIRLYCGEGYGVRVENNLEGGALFTLSIPAKLIHE